MYYAMKDIGSDNMEILNSLSSDLEKWQFVDRIAKKLEYEGIHFSKNLNISPYDMPKYIREYRLSYHMDDTFDLSVNGMVESFNKSIEKAYQSAVENGMENVSIHPPSLPPESHKYRTEAKERFTLVIENWLPKFIENGITFSIEAHIGGNMFLFNKLEDFAQYVNNFPNLCVLVDISHNVNDGYTVDEIYKIFEKSQITGLHLSDAIANVYVSKGTHLPIGAGEIDFRKVLNPFKNEKNVFGTFEIRGTSLNIENSLKALRHLLI